MIPRGGFYLGDVISLCERQFVVIESNAELETLRAIAPHTVVAGRWSSFRLVRRAPPRVPAPPPSDVALKAGEP